MAKFRRIIHVPKKNMDNFKNRPQIYLQGRFRVKILFEFAVNQNKIRDLVKFLHPFPSFLRGYHDDSRNPDKT